MLTPNASPKSQAPTAVTTTTAAAAAAPVLAANQLGLTLQSRGLLVEPAKSGAGNPPTTGSGAAVEPSAPLTPLTPTTPSAGFTLVTLPSHLDTAVLAAHKLEGTVVSVQQIQPDGSTVSIMQ